MPDEPADDLSLELEAAGVDVPAAPAHPIGSANAFAVDSDLPLPASTAPLPAGSGAKVRIGDRIFSALAGGSGILIVVLVALVAAFLLWKAIPAISSDKVNFLTSREQSVGDKGSAFGIAGLLWTTVLISVFAMVIAVPIAVGIALFITNYAPPRLSKPIAYVIDLLAAIPSIIYGIWGIAILAPHLSGIQNGLSSALGWIPIFKGRHTAIGTVFDGGVVLAIMILPIITSISREVFQRTPRANVEAALALGSTRWEMIRLAVLPYGRPGVVSGAMLGLGRALGETIAVTLIVATAGNGAPFDASLFGKGQTFAARIATAGDSLFAHPGPFIASGLVLFILTFIVNAAARTVVNRKAVQ